MRMSHVLLLAGTAAVSSAIFAAAAFGSPKPPGADYAWAQPGCVAQTTCCAQPSFPVGTVAMTTPAAGSSYACGRQPGTAPVTTPFAQPSGH